MSGTTIIPHLLTTVKGAPQILHRKSNWSERVWLTEWWWKTSHGDARQAIDLVYDTVVFTATILFWSIEKLSSSHLESLVMLYMCQKKSCVIEVRRAWLFMPYMLIPRSLLIACHPNTQCYSATYKTDGTKKEAEAIEWSGVELEKGQRIDFLVGGRRSNQPIDDDDRCMQWVPQNGKICTNDVSTQQCLSDIVTT